MTMSSTRRVTFLCLAAVLSAASPLQLLAQPSDRGVHRHRVFGGFGLGVGTATVDCQRCAPSIENDPWQGGTTLTFAFTLGVTLRDNLLLGAEISAWHESRYNPIPDTRSFSLALRAVVLQFYPVSTLPLYLKVGAGLGTVELEDGGGRNRVRSSGWGAQAGAGFDVHLTRSFALSPFVQFAFLGAEEREGTIKGVTVATPARPHFVQGGVALHFY